MSTTTEEQLIRIKRRCKSTKNKIEEMKAEVRKLQYGILSREECLEHGERKLHELYEKRIEELVSNERKEV